MPAGELASFPRGGVYFLAHGGISFAFEPETTPASVIWNREGLAVGGGIGYPLAENFSLAGTFSFGFFGLDRITDIPGNQGTTMIIGVEDESARVFLATADLRFSPYELARTFHPVLILSVGASSTRIGEVALVAYNSKTGETSRTPVSGTGTSETELSLSLGMGAEIRIFEGFTPLAEVRIPLNHTQYIETRMGVRF
jgi:hypothetical protein